METSLAPLVLFIIVGYVAGSLPFAVIFARVFDLADPRSFGSGNPGATNVLRTGNKTAAALTLLGDGCKGWAAMYLASLFGIGATALAGIGLAAFIGHLWPLFLRFKGGKGVATAIGVLIGINVWLALAATLLWLLTAALTRYSSLASIVAAAGTPLVALLLTGATSVTVIVAVMCALVIYRHRANIVRLRAGEEGRIGASKRD